MKKLIYTIPLLLSLNSCIRNSCVSNVEYFKNSDTLYPDYAIPDTLIVMDAHSLNVSMSYIEQGIIESSDKELSDLFYKYCKLLKP